MRALLTGCRKLKEAHRIADSFFPEFGDSLGVIAWSNATAQQRSRARQALHITPRLCERLEIAPPPNPLPPPLTLTRQAERLKRHFAGGCR